MAATLSAAVSDEPSAPPNPNPLYLPVWQQAVPLLHTAHPVAARSAQIQDRDWYSIHAVGGILTMDVIPPSSETLSIMISIVHSLTQPKQSTRIGKNRCCRRHLLCLQHRPPPRREGRVGHRLWW
jgi:hypothetical protein